jgi:hypothetical protein
MSSALRFLRVVSLFFLLSGVCGLVASTRLSERYYDTMPRWSVLEEGRVVPRSIHGAAIYLTRDENRSLSLIEDSSLVVFLAGLSLGFLFWTKLSQTGAYTAEGDSAQA